MPFAAAREAGGAERHACAILSVAGVAMAPVLFGMSMGFSSPAIDVMQDTAKVGGRWVPSPPGLVVFSSDNETSSQGAFFSSVVNIGCLLGALLGAPLSEGLGRKMTIVALGPLFAFSWLVIGLSSSYGLLLAARFGAGMAVGISSCVVPTYINEVSPTSLRGAFGAVFQLGVTVGITLVYCLGAYVFRTEFQERDFCQWRHLAYAFVVPACLLTLAALLIPETPRWLASKGRLDSAKANLKRLRGGASDLDAEMDELAQIGCDSGQSVPSAGFWELVRNRRVVGIGFALMLLQQLSGINAIIFFQNTIFQDAGMDNPGALGFMVMVVMMLVTALSVPLMDILGRKVLLMAAVLGMIFACGSMFIFFLSTSPSWLALVGSFAYVSFFSLGLGAIPWLMMGELFPQNIRSLASSWACAVNWACSFIITETIQAMQEAIGFSGVFACYGVVLVIGAAFVATYVPETKGRSLDELERMLAGRPAVRESPAVFLPRLTGT